MAFILTVVAAVAFYWDLKDTFNSLLNGLDESRKPTEYLIFLMFRSFLLGLIVTTILYFGAKIAIASFDQSARFTKRKMATLFLHFLYEKHKKQIKGDVDIRQLMIAYEIWNQNVESAFSNVKLEKNSSLLEEMRKVKSKDKFKKKGDPKPRNQHKTTVDEQSEPGLQDAADADKV